MKLRHLIFIFSLFTIALSSYAKVNDTLLKSINDIIYNKKADVGVAIIINSKDTILINNCRRYPMMSVFKFHQSIAIAKHIETNNISLDSVINISKEELNPNTYSPLYQKFHDKDLNISIKKLLGYTLKLSDNNACDILFSHILSPIETDSILKSTGISQFSISVTENDMNSNPECSCLNWSFPLASTELLDILIESDFLSEHSKEYITETMIKTQTGSNRIPRQITGNNCIIGHKTGTGGKNKSGQPSVVNDIGFVLLPDGNRFCISVFIMNSEEDIAECESIISGISRTVYDFIEDKNK